MTRSDRDPRVHVLVVVKGLGLGGAERLLVEQVSRGEVDRVRYTIAYVRADKTHFVDDLRAAGAEVVPLGSGGRGRWPVHLARLLRRVRPDVVHSHSPLPAGVARLLVRARVGGRARHVATEHNRWHAYHPPVRWLNAVTMPLDTHIWAVSGEARSSVRPTRLRARVEVLHHGVDRERTRRAAEAPAAGPRSPTLPPVDPAGTVLVHIANHRPEKAHDHLLDAFARAAEDRSDLALWLVGQGLDAPGLRRRLAANPARDHITVLGYRSDAPALLARADALVLSSDHEGLPVAVMEALALGRPVVATAVGGIPEAVRHEVEGLLVPPRDVSALAGAMRRLADEPELADRLGQAARERSASFDAAAAIAVQEDRYRLLAERR